MKRGLKKTAGFVIPIIITILLGEVGVRAFVKLPPIFSDEKVSCYRFDYQLGWFPIEDNNCVYNGSIPTQVYHNTDGLRDAEHNIEDKRPSIAYFGDSFVWGYDVAQDQRITDVAQNLLLDWEIFNFGVSGYGTDQEFLLLQKFFPKYKPEIVILVVHSNDNEDNSTNIRWHYRKPYYQLSNDSLVLKGQPVPTSFNYQAHQYPILFKSKLFQGLVVLYNKFTKPNHVILPDITEELISEFNQYVTSNGSKLLVVFTYDTETKIQKYLTYKEIHHLFAPTHLKFIDYGQHWTVEGHQYIGELIVKRLRQLGWI